LGDSSDQAPHEGATQGQDTESVSGDDSLEGAARDAREIARSRLREELGRDPTDEEIDEWLRRHTEGY
jgi:DNA-directed RNA polymerase specialized sigma subunit